MNNRSNQKGVIDSLMGETIATDPTTGQLDSKSSTALTSSSVAKTKTTMTASQFDTALTGGLIIPGTIPQPTPTGVSVGPTIYIPSGDGYFERELERRGVVGSTSSLDGANFQAAINAFQSTGYIMAKLPPGVKFNIDQPLAFDLSKISLDLNRGGLNFKDLTTANSSAMSFSSSQPTSNLESAWVALRNGTITRKDISGNSLSADSYNNNINGITFDSATDLGSSRFGLYDLYIEGFKDGINFSRNSYLSNVHGCKFGRNYTSVATRNVTAGNYVNQGERMVFSQCIFGNSSEHIYNEQEDFWFSHCSFDYPSAPGTQIPNIANRRQRIMTIKYGGTVRLRDCHLEFRDNGPNSNDTSLIYLEDSLSSFIWDGGRIYCSAATWDNQALSNAADGYPAYANLRSLIQCGGTGIANLSIKNISRVNTSLFKDRALVRLRDTSSTAPNKVEIGGDDQPVSGFINGKSIATVIGDASVTGGGNFGVLKNPTFTSLPTIDPWYQAQTGSVAPPGATNRFASTSLNTTVASNTLTTTKTSAAGTAGRLTLVIPVVQGKKLGLKFTANASVATSAVTMGITYCTISPNGTAFNINPTINGFKTVGSGALALTTSDQVFDIHSLTSASGNVWDSGDRESTSVATHVQIAWTLDALDGSTTPFSLNLKNVTVCWM